MNNCLYLTTFKFKRATFLHGKATLKSNLFKRKRGCPVTGASPVCWIRQALLRLQLVGRGRLQQLRIQLVDLRQVI